MGRLQLKILAYCDQRYEQATRRVVGEGAMIVTSPPAFAGDVELEGYDLIYLDLHGQPGSVYLYSGPETDRAALSVWAVRAANLDGAIIFATTCYLPQTPFVRAFLDAGASAVIGGDGENWGTSERLSGAQVLALLTLRALVAGRELDDALKKAKRKLHFSLLRRLWDRKATADALQFQIWRT